MRIVATFWCDPLSNQKMTMGLTIWQPDANFSHSEANFSHTNHFCSSWTWPFKTRKGKLLRGERPVLALSSSEVGKIRTSWQSLLKRYKGSSFILVGQWRELSQRPFQAACRMSSAPKNLFSILVVSVCASLASPRPQIGTASDGIIS